MKSRINNEHIPINKQNMKWTQTKRNDKVKFKANRNHLNLVGLSPFLNSLSPMSVVCSLLKTKQISQKSSTVFLKAMVSDQFFFFNIE